MLIVGLGNPGAKYTNTRHNLGFILADTLVEEFQRKGARVDELSASKFKALGYKVHTGQDFAEPFFYVLKPQTYMNLSGESVQPFMAWHNISPDNLLVIHDELDIPFNDLRLKTGGGLAGHNGLKSIAQRLGTQDFHRLRIGIGRPEHKDDMANFVLSTFSASEKEQFSELNETMLLKVKQFLNKKKNEKLK